MFTLWRSGFVGPPPVHYTVTMRLMPIAQDTPVASRRGDGFRLGVLVILLAITAMHSVPLVRGAAMSDHDTSVSAVTAATMATHPAAAPQLTAAHTGDAMDHLLHLCLAVLGSLLLLAIGVALVLWCARRAETSARAVPDGRASWRDRVWIQCRSRWARCH